MFVERSVWRPNWYHSSPTPSDTSDSCIPTIEIDRAAPRKLREAMARVMVIPVFKPVWLLIHPPGVEAKICPIGRHERVAAMSVLVMFKWLRKYCGKIVHTDSVVLTRHKNGRYAMRRR